VANDLDRDAAGTEPAPRPVELRGYRIIEPIGRGGMSTVYLAERESDGLKVAIKLLGGRFHQSDTLLPRVIREIAIIARLESPSVVRLLDHGVGDDFVYIAMEYLEGEDLGHYIRLGLSTEQALTVLYQAALALRIIHQAGVIHRDIKPTNIMFRRDGTLVLVDFGFSKIVDDDPGITRQGQVLGTPQYMSPEQAMGLPMDPRTDLYSLGVVFYEMLTGRRLFGGDTGPPADSRSKAPLPLLPAHFGAYQMLLDRLIARRPEARFQTADAVLDYITRVWGVPRSVVVVGS
jgi:eukaryotic-like serine/threonine-protein kinase